MTSKEKKTNNNEQQNDFNTSARVKDKNISVRQGQKMIQKRLHRQGEKTFYVKN